MRCLVVLAFCYLANFGIAFAAPRVAVVPDLASTGSIESPDLGVSDLLAMELQRRGLEVYERQEIEAIISERQLQQSGFTKQSNELIKLPHVDWILSPRVTCASNCNIELESLSVSTGNTKLFSQQFELPVDLPTALGKIATKFIQGTQIKGNLQNKSIRGYTSRPELALSYFKGVSLWASGQPEYALAFFNEAYKSDPSFKLAGYMEAEMYRELGMPEHAKLAFKSESHIKVEPNSIFLSQIDSEFSQVFRESLSTASNFQIVSPESVQNIARELDLDFSSQFSDINFKGNSWLMAKYAVSLIKNDANVELKVYSALRGALVFKTSWSYDNFKVQNAVKTLKAITSDVGKRTKVNPTSIDPEYGFQGYEPYSLQRFAVHLKRYTLDPNDPDRALRLFEAYNPQEWQHKVLLMEELKKSVNGNKNYLRFLTNAIWNQRIARYNNDRQFTSLSQNVGEDFTEVLAGQDELAKVGVLYALGMDSLHTRKYADALKKFEKVDLILERQTQLDVPYQILFSVHHFAGLAAEQLQYKQVASEHYNHAANFAALYRKGVSAKCSRETPADLFLVKTFSLMRPVYPTCSQNMEWEFRVLDLDRNVPDRSIDLSSENELASESPILRMQEIQRLSSAEISVARTQMLCKQKMLKIEEDFELENPAIIREAIKIGLFCAGFDREAENRSYAVEILRPLALAVKSAMPSTNPEIEAAKLTLQYELAVALYSINERLNAVNKMKDVVERARGTEYRLADSGEAAIFKMAEAHLNKWREDEN